MKYYTIKNQLSVAVGILLTGLSFSVFSQSSYDDTRDLSLTNQANITNKVTHKKGNGRTDEESNQKDLTVLDDQIIVGSSCVGLDCVDGESFNFDTIRLKENNVRIRFVDTSTSAAFPTNDWELKANDSANGGENKFSIVDVDADREVFTVKAGAPADALHVNEKGYVGLGTENPLLNQHILTGNTPSIRFEQDGSGGFPSQTWDAGGNELGFFIRDSSGVQVPFLIEPGAPSDSFKINSAGNIELGGSIVTPIKAALPNKALTQKSKDNMMSLGQLETYIANNKQLPEIGQSEKHDMLKFQMQLLNKIQELTVYTIQQENRIQKLEKLIKKSK